MEIVNNQAISLEVPDMIADKAMQVISKAEKVNWRGAQQELLVYWGQEEMSRMAYLLDELQPAPGLPNIPSPIMRDYNWPGIYQPYEHQRVTASYLSLRRRAFCFNEAGTGKTGAVIWAADYLMSLGEIKRVLVVCPVSIMYTAWQAEVAYTAMHRSVAVASGSAERRAKIINGGFEIVIINYDGVSVVSKEIEKAGFDLIVVDEANAYKTVSTQRWKTLAKLVKPHTWLWMMTGTPAAQSPADAYGLARLVSPSRVPKFATAWRDRVMMQRSRFKWEPRPESKMLVHNALQPAIRFTKAECLDLPALSYQTRFVPLTPQVDRYYRLLKSKMVMEAAGEQITAVNAAVAMNKLLQISGGAVYSDEHEVIEFDIKPRLRALEEVLDETIHKVLVFVPFKHTIDIIASHLTSQGYTNEIIRGDVSAKRRADIINRFQQDTDPRVLIIQPQSASHGVTLTKADTIVFWSPVLSVETYIQCTARIDRLGQKNKMTVVNLQGSEVEARVYKMLRGKLDSHLDLVELYKQEFDDV